mgnify:FL=1
MALKVFFNNHPDHRASVESASLLGRPSSVQIGHASLIALAYSRNDRAWLQQLAVAFNNGRDRRLALSRACELLLGTRDVPNYEY